MRVDLLEDMARHQVWADAEHWRVFRGNPALIEDAEIRKRLNHMVAAYQILMARARGETPDPNGAKELPPGELEAAMTKAHEDLAAALRSLNLDQVIALPRGPKGPFEAPAGVLLLQALTHSQHHRGQNASRMRQLGVTPPLTDYVLWYAQGRP